MSAITNTNSTSDVVCYAKCDNIAIANEYVTERSNAQHKDCLGNSVRKTLVLILVNDAHAISLNSRQRAGVNSPRKDTRGTGWRHHPHAAAR